MQYLKIAEITIAVEGWRLPHPFTLFEVPPPQTPDIHARLLWQRMPAPPAGVTPEAVAPGLLLHSCSSYHITYLGEGPVHGISLSEDYTSCVLYANRDGLGQLRDDPDAVMSKNLGVALRHCFIGMLSLREGLLLHSAGIEWQGRGIAFSAASGTGKSTQAGLWRQHRQARILDGDNCALLLRGGQPFLYGLPWCGNSGLAENASAPLEAIVFLEQAGENAVAELAPAEQVLRLVARCYLPAWDPGGLDRCLGIAEKILSGARACLLRCLPDIDAVVILEQWLSRKTSSKKRPASGFMP